MIELCDISSDDETGDTTISSDQINSSLDKTGLCSNACDSPNRSSKDLIEYNTSNIKSFLKEQPDKYVLVDNHKVNPIKPAACWKRFALPAIKNEAGLSIVIKNFATCRSCYTTYSFTLGSTKSLNSHKCAPSTSSSPSFRCLNYSHFTIQHICISSIKTSWKSRESQFNGEKKNLLTSKIAKWVCESMRPLSIVEDKGFLNIIQECSSWNNGEKHLFKFELLNNYLFFLFRSTCQC